MRILSATERNDRLKISVRLKIIAMAERVIALGGYHRCTEDVV